MHRMIPPVEKDEILTCVRDLLEKSSITYEVCCCNILFLKICCSITIVLQGLYCSYLSSYDSLRVHILSKRKRFSPACHVSYFHRGQFLIGECNLSLEFSVLFRRQFAPPDQGMLQKEREKQLTERKKKKQGLGKINVV